MHKNIILIAAGGTGGHVYPGIALADELRQRGYKPVFVVREQDGCSGILDENRCSCAHIPARGMPRGFSLKIFSFILVQIQGLVATIVLLRKLRPVAIAGMGSYISFPVGFIGALMGIPLMVHEQNSLPGLANRVLAIFARKVAISYPDSARYFNRRKTILTGNPVRRDLFGILPAVARQKLGLAPDRFTVLVFGGSQGAAAINKQVVASLPLLTNLKDTIQFLHISGAKDSAMLAESYTAQGMRTIVLPYLHTIGDGYAAADLIICRSGATTMAELQILNKPALLIPFPYATENHQEVNARSLVKSGAAKMVREKDLTPQIIAAEIQTRSALPSISPAVPQIPSPMPQEIIADILVELIKTR